jgi:fermentation-respiration switch protein FrsA (DUF1100 family)
MTTVAQPRSRTIPIIKRLLIGLVLLVVVAYGAALVWLISQETTIVFRAGQPLGPQRPRAPFAQVDLPRADGARQFAWIMRQPLAADRRPWIIYLHGNDTTLASRLNILHCEQLRALGLNVFAPEYRGYAGLEGVPTERGLDTDARVAYDYVHSELRVPPDRIIIYGWSLGSAVAVDLASNVDEAAVILEGAPASLVAIGEQQYPIFPIRLVMRNPFESILKVGRIHAPMLFLHSRQDAVIPIDEGRRLFDAANSPKTFVEVNGGHIYASERDSQTFFGAIDRFLRTQRVLADVVP